MAKYIVEIDGKNICSDSDGKSKLALSVKADNGYAVFCTEIPLTPYTAPDLEQVRKEAYQQGYEQRYKDGYNEPGKEQGQEEQITKGDIVLIKSVPKIEILVTYADVEHVSGIALTEVDALCEIGDQYTNIWISNVEKTGKHYDIAAVLKKMRGEQDG